MDENPNIGAGSEDTAGESPPEQAVGEAETAGTGAGSIGPDGREPAGGGGAEGWRSRTEAGGQMLAQLQEMIDTVTEHAVPVLRDVAAKAAELAAVAAERAGPVAHRAANATDDLGHKVAARSKDVAADLRRAAEASRAETGGAGDETASGPEADEERSTDS